MANHPIDVNVKCLRTKGLNFTLVERVEETNERLETVIFNLEFQTTSTGI